MIHGQVTFKAKLRRGGSDLTLTVGLDHTAGNKSVRTRFQRVVQDIVQFSELVAAETNTGHVIPLYPQPRPAKKLGKASQRLQRRLCA